MHTKTHDEAELLAKLFSGEYMLAYRPPYIRERNEGLQGVYILELRRHGKLIAYGKLVTLRFNTEVVSAYMRVYVAKEYRGRQIGTHIFDALIETAMQHRVLRLDMRSGKTDARQSAFLKRNGFSESRGTFVRILERRTK